CRPLRGLQNICWFVILGLAPQALCCRPLRGLRGLMLPPASRAPRKIMHYSSSYRTLLLLLAVLSVFAVASLWPATPPALSAPAEASAFSPQSSDALWRDVNPEKLLSQQQRLPAVRANIAHSASTRSICNRYCAERRVSSLREMLRLSACRCRMGPCCVL